MSKFIHHPNIVSRKIAGEMILVPIRSTIADMSFLYTLNQTAARIWQLLDGNNSLDQAHHQLCLEFEVDPSEVRSDLEETIQDLLKIGAIVEAQEG